jgi:phosphoenolpyruvate synthase/pyruvate phosphate dikinase
MILTFDQETPAELAGRKGHNLSRLWQAGLPVPPGFCVTWDGIENIDSSDLNCALATLGASAFAVRSSAIQEDAIDASFAGMLLSRLNIPTAEVFSALQDIRSSASSSAALDYSRRVNVSGSQRVAAVVQTFLPAEASGVLFMQDPGSDAAQFIVEACWGLGPGVVEGLVRPDRWTISGNGAVLTAQIADKDLAIVPSEHGGITQIPVDPSCRRRACLTLESLQELSRLAAECARLFGGPQDIEWAVADRVWLLQSRPLTRSF